MNVDIRGAIVPNDDEWVYNYLGYDCTSPKKVAEAIEKAKGHYGQWDNAAKYIDPRKD